MATPIFEYGINLQTLEDLFNFFSKPTAEVPLSYAKERVMIGQSTTQFATQNNAKKKVK